MLALLERMWSSYKGCECRREGGEGETRLENGMTAKTELSIGLPSFCLVELINSDGETKERSKCYSTGRTAKALGNQQIISG